MTQIRSRPRAEFRWSLSRVAEAVGAQGLVADADVTGIALDTTVLQPGDLFVGLPGQRHHGADFSAAARAAGAVAVLTDSGGRDAAEAAGLPFLVVDSPRAVTARLSAAFYDQPADALRMIGVTGTQGKTTATYLAEAGAGVERAAVVGTIGTRIGGQPVGSTLTTPEAPQLQALLAVMREEHVDTCAMEVSSHALVQGRVDGLRFDVAVFLNLGRDHLDFHRDIEDYFRAKARLFTPEHAGAAVVSADDTHGVLLAGAAVVPTATFSVDGRPADWRALNIRGHRLGSDVHVLGPDGIDLELAVPLPGAFNVANALAALAALVTVGHDPAEVAERIARSPGVPGRMERVEAGQEFTAIVDYAHKPDAITAVLAALRPVTAGRLIVVLGAGGDRDTGKRPLMGRAAAEHADLVVVTDDNPRSEDPAAIRAAVLAGAAVGPATVVEIGDRRAAIAHAVTVARAGDTVVVAGKGHEQGQEVAGKVRPFSDRDVLVALIGELA